MPLISSFQNKIFKSHQQHNGLMAALLGVALPDGASSEGDRHERSFWCFI